MMLPALHNNAVSKIVTVKGSIQRNTASICSNRSKSDYVCEK